MARMPVLFPFSFFQSRLPDSRGPKSFPQGPKTPGSRRIRPHPLERGYILLPAIFCCIALLVWSARELRDRTSPPLRAAIPARAAAAGFLPRSILALPPGESLFPSAPPLFAVPAAEEESRPPASLDPAWDALLERLEAEGFARRKMEELFARLGPSSYSPAFMAAKIAELYGVGGIGIVPADTLPPPEGFEPPLADATVGAYRAFTARYAAELKDIQKKHGVQGTVAIAILLVETGLGMDLGKTPALRSLGSMAATTSPALLAGGGNDRQIKRINAARLAATLKAKSDWAFNELVALIRYGERNNLDVALLPGSKYGAVGICQFMPSNIAPYALDGDGDGDVNLFSVADALYSAANYLEAHGWRRAGTASRQFAVLHAYNQDNVYAARVLALSRQLALADKGKVAAGRDLLAFPGPSALSGPRRGGRLFAFARVQPLGSYLETLR
jgi:membrane-bound lytic murein transglycosylase B